MNNHTKQIQTDFTRRGVSSNYLAYFGRESCIVNLAGNYDYLELPYYLSQDLEAEGTPVHPTCKEMLDAYVTPLFLEKARLAKLPTPEYYITNGYFEPPVILDPINPFMIRSRTVLKANRRQSVAKSMTRNYTYAMCCQELPPGSRVAHFRSVMGWSASPRFRDTSEAVWSVFRIPLAKVRVIVRADGKILYSDAAQLPFDTLGPRELAHLEKEVRWVE